jgi:hypothetical protein
MAIKVFIANQQRIKTNVDTVVSILLLFELYYCPKLYLFVNDTQQNAYHKGKKGKAVPVFN